MHNRARKTANLHSCLLPAVVTISLCTGTAVADTPDATPQEAAWFSGKWAVGPADVPGFETIAGGGDCSRAIEIKTTGPVTLQRIVTRRNGERHTAEFTVKSFRGNYPWWPRQGGDAVIAKRIAADTFVLASTRTGRADWDSALQHTRCPN
jgi:hypothetical protein